MTSFRLDVFCVDEFVQPNNKKVIPRIINFINSLVPPKRLQIMLSHQKVVGMY